MENQVKEALRERSFLILGTEAEDFSQGYETFLHYFVGVEKILKAILTGYKTIFLGQNFG